MLEKTYQMAKIAAVTGGNKGIGFEIVKGLCKKFDGTVYLTARNTKHGEDAVKSLVEIGLKPKFHQLDITDINSIQNFHDHIKKQHGGLDLLVNNAGVTFWPTSTEPITKQAKVTLNVNYFALVNILNILSPLLNNGSRVVNVSSSAGHLSRIPSDSIREQLSKASTVDELNRLVNKYLKCVQNGTFKEDGWADSYVVSKVAVSALSFIYQQQLDPRGIIVNAVHPGYVKTDMTEHKGCLSPERGAKSTLFLALEAPDTLKGAYVWDNCDVIDWYSGTTPPHSFK